MVLMPPNLSHLIGPYPGVKHGIQSLEDEMDQKDGSSQDLSYTVLEEQEQRRNQEPPK